ncbi:MAG TPA: response regulator [Spongiibacteraceae bacterium]|nr:response regulator [Spongiibacteraceae bacterium]HUH36914.1 response regulator [Spongiibacteraceae bacterium]
MIQDNQAGALEQVLLVDDNPTNLQILYKTLQDCGYRLLIANSGETALSIARRVRPSLVLLDIMMPEMDGFAVCQHLKDDPRTRDIAVIFLSALGDSSSKVKGFALGGVDYIAKPFQADEVVARVRTHIKIHRLERQLARRNEELEAENQQILNAISEGIIGLDRDGRITLINPAAAAMVGWSEADALGEWLFTLRLLDVDEGGVVEEERSFAYRAYRLGERFDSDMELVRCRNGELLPVSMTCSPRAEGGAVMVLRDISAWIAGEEALRQAREELETQRQYLAHIERLSTTGEMAAGIAHEVNQPLTAVANYARVGKRLLLQDPPDLPRLAELLEKLDIQAVRASDVIQRLRGYVKKPDAGRRAVDINQLLQDVVALAEVDSRVNDIAVHLETSDDLPLVWADPVQIQQVALNLVRNAMEAMLESKHGAMGVIVATHQRDSRVCFEVVDRGPGVSAEAEPKLFQPFFTTKANGMGIGLAICQSIVQAHSGSIEHRPNPEGGAIFTCCLPDMETHRAA